jgi:hypothetical protein
MRPRGGRNGDIREARGFTLTYMTTIVMDQTWPTSTENGVIPRPEQGSLFFEKGSAYVFLRCKTLFSRRMISA